MIDNFDISNDIGFLLDHLKLDRRDPNFEDTPRRVAAFWKEFRDRKSPEIRVFPSYASEIIRLDDYETWGLCGHHLLPVRYNVSISYIPDGRVFGISKLPRIVDYLLKDLPLQEDLPRMIVNYIHGTLNVKYAECSVTGLHLCMTMRGVKAKDCNLTTTARLKKEDYECPSTTTITSASTT